MAWFVRCGVVVLTLPVVAWLVFHVLDAFDQGASVLASGIVVVALLASVMVAVRRATLAWFACAMGVEVLALAVTFTGF